MKEYLWTFLKKRGFSDHQNESTWNFLHHMQNESASDRLSATKKFCTRLLQKFYIHGISWVPSNNPFNESAWIYYLLFFTKISRQYTWAKNRHYLSVYNHLMAIIAGRRLSVKSNFVSAISQGVACHRWCFLSVLGLLLQHKQTPLPSTFFVFSLQLQIKLSEPKKITSCFTCHLTLQLINKLVYV